MAKVTWIVLGMDGFPLADAVGNTIEVGTEKAAIKHAKNHVRTHEDCEAWIYRLSHVVSRPDAEPDVEKIK